MVSIIRKNNLLDSSLPRIAKTVDQMEAVASMQRESEDIYRMLINVLKLLLK